jgi:hypothetical protein
MRILYRQFLTAAMLTSVVTTLAEAETFANRRRLQALAGVYESAAPEKWYGGYGTRSFTFNQGRWALTFVHALDAEMKQKTFAFRTEGTYRVGGRSGSVNGAYEAVFFEDRKFLTLLTPDPKLAQAFGMADCALKYQEEVEISQSGCAGWKPVTQCREDHDLLAMDAKGLYFGERPADNDMCSAARRPKSLREPVVRQRRPR